MANARKLDIDLLDADWLVLSHGHLDHTRGLGPLMRLYADKGVERRDVKRPRLVAHPGALKRKKSRDGTDIGFLLSEEALAGYFDLQVSREPIQLTERLTFLGEIERALDFEEQGPMGTVVESDGERDDWLLDDSALAYRSSRGLVIITGCAHAGICNVVEQAKRVCGDERIVDIVGGLHLLDPPDRRLRKTVEFLTAVGPEKVHACHCTDLRSKIALSGSLELEEVGVGLRLVYP
jgi:7,8-dihydropterin-6-yl-methyl-4-(beta-D-ribofuranosyl)aminobenzene 5'-phosphate synthase